MATFPHFNYILAWQTNVFMNYLKICVCVIDLQCVNKSTSFTHQNKEANVSPNLNLYENIVSSLNLKRILAITLYNLGISVNFLLVCLSFGGLDSLGSWLPSFFLTACLGAVIRGPIQDTLRGLQCLKVLPGAQQGWIIDQSVQQLPAGANPAMTGCLAGYIFLNPWKHRGAGCQECDSKPRNQGSNKVLCVTVQFSTGWDYCIQPQKT